LAITSPTSGGRSVGIVRSRTQTMEFFLLDKKGTAKRMKLSPRRSAKYEACIGYNLRQQLEN
jgi:hypothetical protein